MNNQNDISYLSTEDLEMLLLGTLAFWGDGSLNQEELDLLNQSCKKRIENLELVSFSDSSDQNLSIKEYIIALFEMIENISSDTKIYEDIELPEDFIKSKQKDYQPDNQLKFFFMLTDELYSSYEDDHKIRVTMLSTHLKIPEENDKIYSMPSHLYELFTQPDGIGNTDNTAPYVKGTLTNLNSIVSNESYLKAAQKAGFEILSDIELFVRDTDGVSKDPIGHIVQVWTDDDDAGLYTLKVQMDADESELSHIIIGSPSNSSGMISVHNAAKITGQNKTTIPEASNEKLETFVLEKIGPAETRFLELKNEIQEIAKIDQITDLEEDMISLLDLCCPKETGCLGCFGWILFLGLIFAVVIFIAGVTGTTDSLLGFVDRINDFLR